MTMRSILGRWVACGLVVSALGWTAGCQAPKDKDGDWFAGGEELPPNEDTLRMTARILAAKGDYAKAGYAVDRMIAEYPGRPSS